MDPTPVRYSQKRVPKTKLYIFDKLKSANNIGHVDVLVVFSVLVSVRCMMVKLTEKYQ